MADRSGTLGPEPRSAWSSRWARIALGAAIVAALVVLLNLGLWQLRRLEWKEALIAAAEERPVAAAVAAPGPERWPLDLAEWNYRRIALEGTFSPEEAYAWTTLSDPNGPRGGMGAFVLSPFTTADGWHVIVNRGFVPNDLLDPRERPRSAPPRGTRRVEGLLRRDDPGNFVTPAADLEARVFYSRDIAAIAQSLGLPPERTAPYNVDLVASETPAGGLPQAGESRLAFTNNHLQYALTWFGLAACLVGVTAAALLRRRRANR